MNKQERSEYNKEYYLAHTEKVKEYQKQYRKENPDKIREIKNRYRKAHPEKVKQWRINAAKRLLERENALDISE